jgi:hypothetical protein
MNSHVGCRGAAFAALLIFPLILTARAQDLDDVSFAGVVADRHGARLPGSIVSATHEGTGITRTVKADGDGRYRLVELPPGVYELRAESEGFAAGVRAGISTIAGRSQRVDFTLDPAGLVAEQVIVEEAGGAEIDTTRTVAGGTLTREELERLPALSRSALDFVFTLGGVTEEPLSTRDTAEERDPAGGASVSRAAQTPEEAGAFALAGGAAYSNNITVDGLDNNDDRAARERFLPPLESIEEVQVITNQFSAEYGRASGGRVNLRTRAGSRRHRGRLFHFFRDESLDANTWNNNRRGLKRLPFQEHVAGFTLSGPLGRPRARASVARRNGGHFFFFAYEYRIVLDTTLIDALVPVERNPIFPLPPPTTLTGRRFEPAATQPNAPAELAPFVERVSTPLRNRSLVTRFDLRFGQTHNATLTAQLGRMRDLRQTGGGLRLAAGLQGRERNTEAFSYADNLVLSERAVNQFRAQVSRLTPSVRSRNGASSPVVLVTINDPLDAADPLDRSGTLIAGASTGGATARSETRFQVQETLTLVRKSHTIKAGTDLQRVRSTFFDLTDATGTYNFTSAGDFLASTPARFRQRFNTVSAQRNFYAGLFVQDEWRPRANLTINLGLRYERETVLGDYDNFGPRLGVALDPFGTGRTVLRAGGGIFYNRPLLRTIDDFTLGEGVIEFDTNRLPEAARRPFIAANIRFPTTLTPDSPLVREFGARRTEFARRLDPALQLPESYQLHAAFERELWRGFVFEAGYTFNRTVRLWRETNENAPRLPAGFRDFAEYLSSRDFSNFRDATGARPIYDTSTAGDLVRFAPLRPGSTAVARTVEFGVPITLFDLNSVNSTTVLEAALAALRPLRPDPTRTQLEQLSAIGNSFYHGLVLEARRRFRRRANGLGGSMRAAYTLSRLLDDGVVNTSSALIIGDFRRERARSLLDRRHRLSVSGAPFNLTLGGADRNLDDVSNDRPSFSGDLTLIRWRRPGAALDARLLSALSLPAVGRTGNLPRNAGQGPPTFTFDLKLAREFRRGERLRLRPSVEIDNVLNAAIFTFGAEFINFSALRADATPAQRQALLDTFLVPTRTLRPRTIRLGVRLDF